MKRILKKQSFTLGILIVLTGLLASPMLAVHAQAPTPIQSKMTDTTIAISLANPMVKPGDDFDININITTDTPTRGMQTELHYDPKLIEISGFTEGTFYKAWAQANNASTVMVPNPSPDNQNGVVPLFSIVVVGGATGEGPKGSGTLVIFHAKAKAGASGTATLNLNNIIISDAGDAFGAASPFAGVKVQDGIVGIGVGTGIVQPTAYPLLEPTAVVASTQGPEPTAVRRTSSSQGSGQSPWGIWVIVIPLAVAGLIGVFTFFSFRKKPKA